MTGKSKTATAKPCPTNHHAWVVTSWRKVRANIRAKRVLLEGIPMEATCGKCDAAIMGGIYQRPEAREATATPEP